MTEIALHFVKPPKIQLQNLNCQDRPSETKARQSGKIRYILCVPIEKKKNNMLQKLKKENSIKQPVTRKGKKQHEICHGCVGPHIGMGMQSCDVELLQKS